MPVRLFIATAVESAVLAAAFPQYLPAHLLLYLSLSLYCVQFTALLFYNSTIYPRFVSPLRGLPHPKVNNTLRERTTSS